MLGTGYGRPAHKVGQDSCKEKVKNPTIVLEAVALKSLRIWYALVGTSGALNDINVLNWSQLFDSYMDSQHNMYIFQSKQRNKKFLSGTEPLVSLWVNRTKDDLAYYLVNGIYPKWPVIIQTLQHAHDATGQHFSQIQEAGRKYIKGTFDGFQAGWRILAMPCHLCDLTEVQKSWLSLVSSWIIWLWRIELSLIHFYNTLPWTHKTLPRTIIKTLPFIWN